MVTAAGKDLKEIIFRRMNFGKDRFRRNHFVRNRLLRMVAILCISLSMRAPQCLAQQEGNAYPAAASDAGTLPDAPVPAAPGPTASGPSASSSAPRGPAIGVEKDVEHPIRRDILLMGKNFWLDQKQVWTSPSKFRPSDSTWLFPILGITAGLIQTDGSYNAHLGESSKTIGHYNTFSNVGVAALAGGAGGMYLLSLHSHNDKRHETGFLSAEAALNSVIFVEVAKYVASRDRPTQGNMRGEFFQPGGASFPSMHSTVAWSVAGVIAHEYPGPLTKVLVYSLAAAVSYSRVHAQQHFPSDVFVGQIAGNMIGQSVYSNHHDTELGGVAWQSLRETFVGESATLPGNQGSPYVPLDSWVYPLFDRLKALGYVPSESLGMRPWTRIECARLITEAESGLEERGAVTPDAERMVGQLEKEFSNDIELLGGGTNQSAHLESMYTRFTGISGTPLNDSFHFGQTFTEDYGRPFAEGFNNVTGFSGSANYGRWTVYARGEYQFAPSAPGYSADVRQFIAAADVNPVQPGGPSPQVSQYQLLDAYAGLTMNNWQLSFGQQSLDWGPTRTGSFLMSNNAVPINMIRLNRTTPFYLPSFLRFLGAARIDLFFGSIAGNQFPPNPFLHGEKLSLMPLKNLEFGFTRTVEVGGQGEPLTLRRLVNSYISTTARGPGQNIATDPGKRTGGFDVSYTVPLRLLPFTFYLDSIADDNTSPLADFRRAGVNPGLYFPKLPWLPHLDLRVESSYTDVPFPEPAGNFIYWDHFYHDLYTNNGQLFGNPVGRDGKSYQAWSRYWLGPRSNIEFSYRHMQVSPRFITGGGNINDASVHTDFWMRHSWDVSATVQYERWNYPILAPGPQVNVSASVGITYSPEGGLRLY
jgi:membrane-associated phospholipid phosphatase